jgi:hypothetical protein
VLRAVPETGFGPIPVRRVPPLLLDFCWLADIHASTTLVTGLKSLSIAHPIGSEFLDTWPHRGIHLLKKTSKERCTLVSTAGQFLSSKHLPLVSLLLSSLIVPLALSPSPYTLFSFTLSFRLSSSLQSVSLCLPCLVFHISYIARPRR